jgi:peptide deformylase
MAVYQIVREENPVLRQKSKIIPAVTPGVLRLLEHLKDTLAAQKTGVGLAAPQIGISKRAIVVRLPDEEYFYELINPEIVEREGVERDSEGCLSIPDWVGDVDRAAKIRVKALDRLGNPAEYEAEGYLARVFQHEIDHLDGILFVDRAVKMSPAEKEA